MATLLLVRHGRTKANTDGVLAGWTPGVGLDETGQEQAKRLAARLDGVPLNAVVTSPLQRCRETAAAFCEDPAVDERIGEVRYGDWQGRTLKDLAGDPLWQAVQQHPSSVTFPGAGGESMRAMSARAIDAARDWDARVTAEHGADGVWAAVSHGDVIKAILADALGLHLDQFQRLAVSPCSVSVIRYTPLRPFVVRLNETGASLAHLLEQDRTERAKRPDPAAGETGSEAAGEPGATGAGTQVAESDAQVGGGVGS